MITKYSLRLHNSTVTSPPIEIKYYNLIKYIKWYLNGSVTFAQKLHSKPQVYSNQYAFVNVSNNYLFNVVIKYT